MSAMASQITSLAIVYSTVYSGTDERKHQSSASLAFVRGIHWRLVNSPHKGPCSYAEDGSIWWRHHITQPVKDGVCLHTACHSSGHYRHYCPGALPLSQITATHLKIGYSLISSADHQMSCRDCMTVHQDSDLTTGCWSSVTGTNEQYCYGDLKTLADKW